MKKLTQSDFIKRAKEVHGDRFDYSKCVYKGMTEKVVITCKKHGDFLQLPHAHLKGQGCKKCTRGILGVGILDLDNEDFSLPSYARWRNILIRSFSDKYKNEHPTYKNVTLSQDWIYYSNFKQWFYDPSNGYIDGYQLDKDLLVKGVKIYSPETCCFLPQELNKLLTKRDLHRGELPIGVHRLQRKSAYRASLQMFGKTKNFGYFKDPMSAFQEYKKRKEQYIKELAEDYFNKSKITQKVYEAMMRYKVDADD